MAVVTRHVDEARAALSRRGSSGTGDATGGETVTMRRLPPGLVRASTRLQAPRPWDDGVAQRGVAIALQTPSPAWLLLLLQHILGIITLEDCLLAVLNDDAHAQSRRSGDAPPNHAAILGGEASSRGHGGHGHSHQGGGGGASSRRGGGGSGGGGSLISDATDMQHVARILARRQQHPHTHAHGHLHPHPPAHHPHGGAAAVAAAAPESAEDRDANSS